MNRYDPDHTPNPEEWLSLDEHARIRLAEEYHRVARVKLPDLNVHAMFHVIIENQLAENLESAVRAIDRLKEEGLSRHDAVHAICSVAAEHCYDLLNAKTDVSNSRAIYNAAVERLTAKGWRGG